MLPRPSLRLKEPMIPTPTLTPPDTAAPVRTRTSARVRLRNYFLTGVIVAGPVAITIYVTWWFISLIDGWVKPLVPTRYLPETYLPFTIPGFGLIIAFAALTTLGFLTANLVGRTLIDFGEVLLNRMPVIRGIYRGTKQVFQTIFSTSGTSFRTVGLVQFPVKGTWSIVFIANPASPEIGDFLPTAEEHIGVFLPCTPNPTTGFFFYLPRKDIIELSLSVDDAAKLVMSAGVIQPDETQRRLQKLAETARNGAPHPELETT
jgi:uncharacterized membrane protein